MAAATPEIRFEGFADPWEQRKFGELVVIERGGSPRPIESFITTDVNGLNWVKIGDAPSMGRYITSTSEKIRPEGLSKTRQVYPGDLILSNSMSFGRPYIMAVEGCIHDGWLLIRDVKQTFDPKYLCHMLGTPALLNQYRQFAAGSTVNNLNKELVGNAEVPVPSKEEQVQVGRFLDDLDTLITLHQRELRLEGSLMIKECQPTDLFCFYYEQWVQIYKEGAIRAPTMSKYKQTQIWLEKLVPDLAIQDMDRMTYQKLINDYALHHEKQTTMDFHHQLKGAILDAVDDGLIPRDPTRKVIIKGKPPRQKKQKYLSQFELHELLNALQLGSSPDWDWLILLIAKTGLRFSEALAVTPSDFDFAHQTLSINKTWNYKEGGGFAETKNQSSVRKVQLDWQLVVQFSELVKCLPKGKPVFVREGEQIYNSTANAVLARRCSQAGVPDITIHGLRHTHASLLLFAGVSIASVARRLGHASITTTQKTYLHIIQELENQDVDLVMRSLSNLI